MVGRRGFGTRGRQSRTQSCQDEQPYSARDNAEREVRQSILVQEAGHLGPYAGLYSLIGRLLLYTRSNYCGFESDGGISITQGQIASASRRAGLLRI
jgi:hypothetical protein